MAAGDDAHTTLAELPLRKAARLRQEEWRLNSPAFLRRLRVSVCAAARSRRATAFRSARACASCCRTSRCSRRRFAGFLARPVGAAPDPLALEQVEEALGDGVIMALTAPAHGMLQVVSFQETGPVPACELAALIGMDQHLGLWLPPPCGHEQSLERDVGRLGAVRRMRTRLSKDRRAALSGSEEAAPLSESGGAVLLEDRAGGEDAFQIEVVVNRGVDGGELLQTSHLPESLHRPLAPSERKM